MVAFQYGGIRNNRRRAVEWKITERKGKESYVYLVSVWLFLLGLMLVLERSEPKL